MASLGHPLLGDDVYGDRAFNRVQKARRLMLCATRLTLHTDGKLPALEGKTFTIPCPFSRNPGLFSQSLQRASGFTHPLLVVRLPADDPVGPVNLFQQDDPHQLMGKCEIRKGQLQIRSSEDSIRESQ